jgi:hypothetical protein
VADQDRTPGDDPPPRRRRFWWPTPVYEARPAMSLILGGLAAFLSLRAALYAHDQSLLTAGGLGLGGVLALYGGITQQVRNDFRQSVRRRVALEAERKNRELGGGAAGRPPVGSPRVAAGHRAGAGGRSRFGTVIGKVAARAAPALPRDPLERRALLNVTAGGVLTAASIGYAWFRSDFDAVSAGGLVVGSVLALYGALLQQMCDEERRRKPD